MRLKVWFATTETTVAQLAEDLKVDATHVSKWNNGHTMPRPQMLATIRKYTDGKVTVVDFHEHWLEKHPEA